MLPLHQLCLTSFSSCVFVETNDVQGRSRKDLTFGKVCSVYSMQCMRYTGVGLLLEDKVLGKSLLLYI